MRRSRNSALGSEIVAHPLRYVVSTAISPRVFCETIFCAMAPVDAFAMAPGGKIDLEVHVMESARTFNHRVQFDGVSRYQCRESAGPAEPGDQFEFSVIELEREDDGWRVFLNPWYVREIEFRCRHIWLDGREVVGEGRWFQDGLPGARPA